MVSYFLSIIPVELNEKENLMLLSTVLKITLVFQHSQPSSSVWTKNKIPMDSVPCVVHFLNVLLFFHFTSFNFVWLNLSIHTNTYTHKMCQIIFVKYNFLFPWRFLISNRNSSSLIIWSNFLRPRTFANAINWAHWLWSVGGLWSIRNRC